MGDDDVDEALAAFRAFWEREEAAADAADAAWAVSRVAPGRDEKQKQKNAGKTRKNEQPKNNL